MSDKFLREYLYLFENLKLENINKFDRLIDKNIIFKDPFNKIKGKNEFKRIFKNTLHKIKKPKFKILKVLSLKNINFVKWEMTFVAFGKTQKIIGLSEIKLNKEGKVKFHYDYWDSFEQFYLKLPYLGKILNSLTYLVKSKI